MLAIAGPRSTFMHIYPLKSRAINILHFSSWLHTRCGINPRIPLNMNVHAAGARRLGDTLSVPREVFMRVTDQSPS